MRGLLILERGQHRQCYVKVILKWRSILSVEWVVKVVLVLVLVVKINILGLKIMGSVFACFLFYLLYFYYDFILFGFAFLYFVRGENVCWNEN